MWEDWEKGKTSTRREAGRMRNGAMLGVACSPLCTKEGRRLQSVGRKRQIDGLYGLTSGVVRMTADSWGM